MSDADLNDSLNDDIFDLDEAIEADDRRLLGDRKLQIHDEDEDRYDNALRNFTQRTQSGITVVVDTGEAVQPRNELEKLLSAEYQIELKRDENFKLYIYLGGGLNHASLVQKFDKTLENRKKREDLVSEFEMATGDRECLELYLSPTNSACGLQDTIFRAFLLCRHTQTKMFEILMHHMQILAKSTDDASNQLAVVCVAQMRYLDRVIESHALFQSIFDRDVEDWAPGARDALIEALPEVLTDHSSQQDAATNLLDMILRRPSRESQSFRAVILTTLKLLRTDGPTAKRIRRSLSRSVMDMEAPTIPDLVSFAIETLLVDTTSTFRDVLNDLAASLKLDELRITRGNRSRISVDDVVLDVFSRICRYLRLEGPKGWKEVVSFLKRGKDLKSDDVEEREGSAEVDSVVEPENKERSFDMFDLLLSFALLSMEGCPSTVITNLKNQIILQPENIERFIDICKTALQYRKFCFRHCSSLIQLARHCLWAVDGGVKRFGATIYTQLFIVIEKTRETVLPPMLEHLSKSEGEAAAVFSSLEQLIDSHLEELLPFVNQLHRCLDLVEVLSVDNIKRMYNILVLIYTKAPDESKLKDDVEESIIKFCSSVNEREQMWGVLGMLVQLQAHLVNSCGDARESVLREILDRLESVTSSSTWLRAVFYQQLASILRTNMRCAESSAMLAWTDKLFESFQRDFFVERGDNYVSNTELEADKFLRPGQTNWLCVPRERQVELVPMFELLKEAALVKQRWSTDDDTQMAINHHWSQFFFAFDANISMSSVSTRLTDPEDVQRDSADYLYHIIDWIRMILNTFSTRESIENVSSDVLQQLWTKKFALMFECQKHLQFRIKMLQQWRLPSLSMQSERVTVLAESAKSSTKRTKKPDRKAGKKRRRTADPDGNEESTEGQNPTEEGDDAIQASDAEETADEHETAAADRDTATPSPERENSLNKGSLQTIPLASLVDRLRQLKLATVVRLIVLIPDKRRATKFLLDELLKILRFVLPKRERKAVPWETKASSPSIDPSFHGDLTSIWKLVLKVMPVVWISLNKTTEFFRADLNSSDVSDRNSEVLVQLASLLHVSLLVFTTVLSSKEVGEAPRDESDRNRRSRREKRRILMEKIEHVMIATRESQEESSDDAEITFLSYLVNSADVVPTVEVAVALLDVVSSCTAWSLELKEQMARHALCYLKREWRDDESNPLRGGQLNGPVRHILEHYIRLRPEEHQLACIQWLLANKVAELVPDDERRKSKIYSYESTGDPGLTEEDKRSRFACFSKHTFTGIYKVLFSSINTAIARRLMHTEELKSGTASPEEVLSEWKLAGNSFCLLGLMLRVKELRNAAVLTSAVRDGKRFLALFSKNSSFMYIIDDQSRFSPVSALVSDIIKTVQLGNRTLQNVSVYAKTMKSASLLKSLPELRASSEMWMRAVHSSLVSLGCHQAFEIGLLKSRDIDGEEIRNPDETADDDEEEGGSGGTGTAEAGGENGDGEENASDNDIGGADENSRASEVY